MTTETLTERQAKALHFIGAFIDKHGFSPTLEEIGLHLGAFKPAVFEIIDRLISKGRLTKRADVPRSIKLTKAGQAWYDRRDWHPNVALTFVESVTQHASPGVESL